MSHGSLRSDATVLAVECHRPALLQEHPPHARAYVSGKRTVPTDDNKFNYLIQSLQESSITEAVERQLNNSHPPPPTTQSSFALTPQMGKKQQQQSHSLASSEHALTPLSDTGTVSSAKQLSTFAANKGVATPTTSSIPSSVQMRRTTNKRGKQAPAPPKRTR